MIKISDEIKAKIVIEADVSGADEAAAALEKLQGMAGDGSIGDALAQQFKAGEEGAKNLTEALGDSGEALKANEEAFNANEEAAGSATQAIEEQTQVVGDLQSAHEDLQPAIEDTNKNLTSMQEMLAKSTPAFSQAAENMSAFQDALVNPEPFSTVQQYLGETGQSWGDFIDSVGSENANQLVNAQNNLNGISNGFVEANKSAGTFTDTFTSTQAAMDEFNQADPWAAMAVSANDASKAVESVGTATETTGKAVESFSLGSFFKSAGQQLFGGVSETGSTIEGLFSFGGLMAGLNELAMPLFAVQMIGATVSQVGQAIYNASAIAEGPGAHGFGTFTGAVDSLGYTAQQVGGSFSEAFGNQFMATIGAVNQALGDNAGGLSATGSMLGGAASFASNELMGALGIGLMFTGVGIPLGFTMAQAGMEGVANNIAEWSGMPPEFTGQQATPAMEVGAQVQQGWSQIPTQTIKDTAGALNNTNLILTEASDPSFLDAQNQLSHAQQYMQYQQNQYNAAHPYNQQSEALQSQNNYNTMQDQYAMTHLPTYWQGAQQDASQGDWGGFFSNIGEAFGFGSPSATGGMQNAIGQDWHEMGLDSLGKDWGSLFGGIGNNLGNFLGGAFNSIGSFLGLGGQTPDMGYTGGVGAGAGVGNAGGMTNYLRSTADQTSGGFQLPHIDLGSIASNLGSQFSGIQLPHLDLGSMGSTLAGAFSGIALPHLDLGNIGSSLAGAFGGITLPHLDLGNIGSTLAGAFGGITLPHLDLGNIGSSLAGAFSGIQLPHLDLGNIGASLAGAFSGIQMPSIPNLGGMINGALSGMFSGITLPSIPDIGGMINGALGGMFSGITLPSIPNIGGMINGALGGMFGGITMPSIPDIGGMVNGALGGMFGGIQMPNIPDVGGMINGALSGMFSAIHMPQIPPIGSMINAALSGMFSGIMIPGFASGVEGFGGGLAVVGESGPELVSLPGGSSVYPMSTGGMSPVSLSGGGGGSGAQTANISIYLGTQLLTQIMGMSLASDVNISTGNRAF